VPYKDKEISKLYYSIGEVAKMLEVNPSLIRFWEKSFQLDPPKKNRKGNRLFTMEEIQKLKQIHFLVKEKGFTLAGAREHLWSNKTEENEKSRLIHSLKELKSFLLEIRDSL
jgi:DNA-binding transcriptional MerR regulator